jgi:hypothetical protein
LDVGGIERDIYICGIYSRGRGILEATHFPARHREREIWNYIERELFGLFIHQTGWCQRLPQLTCLYIERERFVAFIHGTGGYVGDIE